MKSLQKHKRLDEFQEVELTDYFDKSQFIVVFWDNKIQGILEFSVECSKTSRTVVIHGTF